MTKRKPNPRAETKGGCMLKTVHVKRGIKNQTITLQSSVLAQSLSLPQCSVPGGNAGWVRTMEGFED